MEISTDYLDLAGRQWTHCWESEGERRSGKLEPLRVNRNARQPAGTVLYIAPATSAPV